jgi:hypothetical protein
LKYIIIKFFGWIFLIIGYWTAVALIGIPIAILGSDMILYAEKHQDYA